MTRGARCMRPARQHKFYGLQKPEIVRLPTSCFEFDPRFKSSPSFRASTHMGGFSVYSRGKVLAPTHIAVSGPAIKAGPKTNRLT
jgi:hypothetical protein